MSDTTDAITLSVIQAGLAASADEMFAVLRKTAMSPIISEVLDAGTGITDAKGNLVSSGAGIPTFVGVLDKAVTRIIDIHEGSIDEGDMFVTNDPYYGGVTHPSDVVVALPIFHQGRRVAWAASIAHWNDIGGRTPGSMSVDATDIWQEGLRLPAVRLMRKDQPIDAVFDIVTCNSRLPDFVMGDLWAQIAAARTAARRVEALLQNYGDRAFADALDDAFASGEARVRAGLRTLPEGRHSISEPQDDGTNWEIAVEVTANRFIVDLRAAPPQRMAPFNTSRDGAVISAQMILKAIADPSREANAGSFRPLEVLTTPGTIFHAMEPAPHGYYFETRIRLYDALWRCLATAMPDRLPAGHFASICGTVIAGTHPDTGRRYTMVEPQMGGWGATVARDGLDAMYSASHGDTFNCPVEIAEARYGIDVAWKRLRDPNAEGTGRHVGGRGLSTCYQLRAPAIASAGFSRAVEPVWGSAGGTHGGINQLMHRTANGTETVHAFVSGLRLHPGDSVHIDTAAGGGWGKPKAKPQA